MRRHRVWVGALVLLATACSGSTVAPAPTTDPAPTAPSPAAADTSSTEAPAVCGRYDVEGCVPVVAVVDPPLMLDELLVLADPWLPIAVYRTEPACVASDDFPEGPDEPQPHELSYFAYVEASQIRVRRTTTEGAPPISGWIIAEAAWRHFEAEWIAALSSGGTFWGIVVYLPDSERSRLESRHGVRDVLEVPAARSTPNPEVGYPGELFLSGNDIPEELFEVPATVRCDPEA